MANKNIYMGSNSTANILVNRKVDQDWEILAKTHATAYDSINGKMLTRSHKRYDQTTINEIKKRFRNLKLLALKHAPHTLDDIKYLEECSILNTKGVLSDKNYLSIIRGITIHNGLNPNLVMTIEQKVNQAEGIQKRPNMINPFINTQKHKKTGLFDLFPPPKSNKNPLQQFMRLPTKRQHKQTRKRQNSPNNIIKKMLGFK